MGSILGGPQTVNTNQSQNTLQNINQASQQQQQMNATEATAANPLAQGIGLNIGNMLQSIQGYGGPGGGVIGPLGGAFMGNGTPQAPGNSYIPWLGTADITPQGQQAIQAMTTSGMGLQPLIGQGQGYVQQAGDIFGQAPGLINQGAGFINESGQPITGADVGSFYNPFAENVTANLQDIFGQQNLANRIGATAQSGGVGASRAAVGQALLAQKQGLTAGGVYADLYQRALQAAQQQKAQQLGAGQGLVGAGGTMAGVGGQLAGSVAFPAIQTGMGGINAAVQAQDILRQRQQQEMNARYQFEQQLYQDPFLRLQATTGTLPGLIGLGQTGVQTRDLTGTTTLAGTQTGFGTGTGATTYPAPSAISQLAGLGLAGAGLFKIFGGNQGGRVPKMRDGGHVLDFHKNAKGVYQDGGSVDVSYSDDSGSDQGDDSDSNSTSDLDDSAQQAQQQLAKQKRRQNYMQQIAQLAKNTQAFQKAFPQPGAYQRAQTAQPLTWPKTPWNIGQMPAMQGGGSIAPNFGGRLPNTAANWAPSVVPAARWLTAPSNPAPYVQPLNYQNLFNSARSVFPTSLGMRQEGGAVSDLVDRYDPRQRAQRVEEFKRDIRRPYQVPREAPKGGWLTPLQEGGRVQNWEPQTEGEFYNLRHAKRMMEGPGFPSLPLSRDIVYPTEKSRFPIQKYDWVRRRSEGTYQEGGPVDEIESVASSLDDQDDSGHEPTGLPTQESIPLPMARPTGDIPGEETGDLTAGASPFGPRGRVAGYPGLGGLLGGGNRAGTTSPYMALLQAGLGMMAASGQRDARGLPMSPLGAIGTGGLAGVNAWERGQQQNAAMDLKRQSLLRQDLALADLMRHRRAIEARTGTAKRYKMTDPNTLEQYLVDEQGNRVGAAAAPQTVGAVEEQGKAESQTGVPVTGAASLEPGGDRPTAEVPEPLAAGGLQPGGIKFAAEQLFQTGSMPPGMSRNRLAVAAVTNYAEKLATSRGLTLSQAIEMQRFNKRQAGWIMGVDGRQAGSMGTLIDHLSTLDDLTKALKNGDNQTYNLIKNKVAKWTGSEYPTNVQMGAQIVGAEILKAIGITGGATGEERVDAGLHIGDLQKSPAQFSGAINVAKRLAAGQLNTKLRQARSIGLKEERIEALVGADAYKQLKAIGQPKEETGQLELERSERPTPTDKDRAYIKAHPEKRDLFIKRFGVEP